MTENIHVVREINCLFLIALRDEALRDPKAASFIYQVPTSVCQAIARLTSSQTLELARHSEEVIPRVRDFPQKFWPLICREMKEENDVDRLAMKLTILLSN